MICSLKTSQKNITRRNVQPAWSSSSCTNLCRRQTACCITSDTIHLQLILLCGRNQIVGSFDGQGPSLKVFQHSLQATADWWHPHEGFMRPVSKGLGLSPALLPMSAPVWFPTQKYAEEERVIFLWIYIFLMTDLIKKVSLKNSPLIVFNKNKGRLSKLGLFIQLTGNYFFSRWYV